VKHTYLFPLGKGERWLWRTARMDAGDLFGLPDTEEIEPLWVMQARIADAIGEAREELHERLKSRDRICIGRHYVIPGTLCEGAQDRARSADGVVREITEMLWDAPLFRGELYTRTFQHLERSAGRGGRDGWGDIAAFLRTYGMLPEEGEHYRLVPVWM
jgi:hypothetical protein